MKVRVIGDTLGLVPESEEEKSLLKDLYNTGIFAQSFGIHSIGDTSELRLTIVTCERASILGLTIGKLI